jgi:DTW domain-containing protein YfiP
MGRLHSDHRCPKCKINELLCFCDLIPKIQLETKVLIIMHKAEVNLTSNTATLAKESLINSEIRLRGIENAPVKLDDLDDEYENYVLFPSGNAEELNPGFRNKRNKKIRLIIPDGSWSQAKKMIKREKQLINYPKVKLPEGPASNYRLRKEPTLESVSTFEAIARALGILEGEITQTELETIFNIMVERTLWGKSKIHENDCFYPIPEKAINYRYSKTAFRNLRTFKE